MRLAILIFLFIPAISFSQLYKEFEKDAKKYRKFYAECVNQYLVENSKKLEIISWDLKSVKIDLNPEEGSWYVFDIEIEDVSEDSIQVIKSEFWTQSIYDLEIEAITVSGEEVELSFFLSPNGRLFIHGTEYQMKLRD